MKRCNNCHINFNTKYRLCPLCQNRLVGSEYDEVFPDNKRSKALVLVMKYILFCSIVVLILSSFIEIYFFGILKYTYLILGILLTNYIIVHFTLKNRKNILSLLGKYGLLLIVISLLWYYWIKSSIIIDYIIPGICICELIFNVVIFIILRSKYVVNYFSLILLNSILLILPVILIMLDLTTNNILSYISFLLALIILVWLFIFYFDDILEEFAKFLNL